MRRVVIDYGITAGAGTDFPLPEEAPSTLSAILIRIRETPAI
jgi:hypothetical protein